MKKITIELSENEYRLVEETKKVFKLKTDEEAVLQLMGLAKIWVKSRRMLSRDRKSKPSRIASSSHKGISGLDPIIAKSARKRSETLRKKAGARKTTKHNTPL